MRPDERPEEWRVRLPAGYLDARGRCVRECSLRAATAVDEVRALQDFRVHLRPESFLPLMLARTLTRLGDLPRVDVRAVENLCGEDLRALEDAYRDLNGYPPRASDSNA